MRLFRRTRNGLNNQYLFYNVDITLYVEGGSRSYTKAEVISGLYNEETEDIIFWRSIFSEFKTSKRIKYKSIGSKKTVKEIAEDIVSGGLDKVMVAMDNEFDEILNNRILHSNIFYTHGYSYENDIWNIEVIKSVIEELTAVKIKNKSVELAFKAFLRLMKLPVYADGFLFKQNSTPFFPRQNGIMFCVNCKSNDLPDIRKDKIEDRLNSMGLFKKKLYSFGNKNKIDTHKFCFGHLLADYCCHIIIGYIKKEHSLNAPRKEILYRMGIRKYFQLCFINSPLYTYYSCQLSRV